MDLDLNLDSFSQLERKLIKMYLEKATSQGKMVEVITDRDKYAALRTSKQLFSKDHFYLLMNKDSNQVLDLAPVIYHMVDTLEGEVYARQFFNGEPSHF